MADYSQFREGGAQFPLVSSTSAALLFDADPAVYYLLDYLTTVLNTHLGARFAAELGRAPAMALPQVNGQAAGVVAMAMPYDPTPYLTQEQIGFPLLAVYRKSEKYARKRYSWMSREAEIGVTYVLPPLTGAQAERLRPLLGAVGQVIDNRIENMFDPSYQGGLTVWATANIEEISLASAQYGDFAGSNLSFPAWNATIRLVERTMPLDSQFGTLAGLDTAIDLMSPVDAPLLDAADVKTDFIDPTTIPTIATLLRGDAGLVASTTNQDVAATWTDQVGSVAFSVPGGAAAPDLLKNAVVIQQGDTSFGRTAVRFDGIAQTALQGTVASLANDSGKTLVVLARFLNTQSRGIAVAHTLASDTGTHTSAIEANVSGTAGQRLGFEAAGSSYDATSPVDSNWHVLAVRETNTASGQSIASTVTYSVDGTSSQPLTLKAGAGTWSGMATSNLLTLGANPASLATTAASVDIGVVMAFTSALSNTDLATAIRFCQQWLGVSGR